MPGHILVNYTQRCRNLLDKIRQLRQEGRQFIYLDEINFTKRSVNLREWSAKNSNLTVDQQELYVGYRSVIASMSEEGGIILLQIFPKAIKSEDFENYLYALSRKMKSKPLAVFMDQLAVHKSE